MYVPIENVCMYMFTDTREQIYELTNRSIQVLIFNASIHIIIRIALCTNTYTDIYHTENLTADPHA